jgi:hypothetical protein
MPPLPVGPSVAGVVGATVAGVVGAVVGFVVGPLVGVVLADADADGLVLVPVGRAVPCVRTGPLVGVSDVGAGGSSGTTLPVDPEVG